MSDPLSATLWGLFEIALDGPSTGNPFLDVTFEATFSQGGTVLKVPGFYDGDGVYRLRFMPQVEGVWQYQTSSNVAALDGVEGSVNVGPAKPGDHGPVRAVGEHFRYADGSRYINIGTTAYVWNLQGDAMEEETLATLADAPFTKIRMCVFPKHYRYNQNEPPLYPFALLKRGTSEWGGAMKNGGWEFDCDRIEPAYFRHLEKRIADLNALGVEADLILLHPYDRWGFAHMSAEQDDRYLRYVVARLTAFPNVWWSMANEYDFMFNKTLADWDRMIGVVAEADPFGHLLSVHNGFAPYDYSDKRITHVSIQRPYTDRIALWRKQFGKPVSDDECCYEGDIAEHWGNISGRELVHRFWDGTVAGGSVTHGETFYNDVENLWWAKGGKLVGESVSRIAFLKNILEAAPEEGLDPVPTTGAYKIMMAGGLDHADLRELISPNPGEEGWVRVGAPFATAGQPHRYYLTYFGQNQPGEFAIAVPPEEHYRATLIDTWEMTETVIAESVQRGDVLRFKAKPYQALRLNRIEA
ncbi:DUF5060 domain-containing protein [Devosia sp. Leaf64]|uniref:DUF5060 domain-containing protein n=1 Tax=Devosia sp. Leaf64 TaxID=1736229 RepID=UPI000715B86A|nr:DUF5060 domain-containing protein [Devosia sp. Leaf64]KQN75201.1 hypothetical protein ASE94_02470 [Devosia sp. Leaf64]